MVSPITITAPPPAAHSGSFSLFPNTSNGGPTKSQSRNQHRHPRPRAPTPQHDPSLVKSMSSPWRRRANSLQRTESTRRGKGRQPQGGRSQSAMDGRLPSVDIARRDSEAVMQPPPVSVSLADVPARCETAFSEAPTLVRANSTMSHSSIVTPLVARTAPVQASSSSSAQTNIRHEPQTALRSIFPQYNPDVPLDCQDYFPTQASPTHIPRSAISRPLYSPTEGLPHSPPARSPMVSPLSGGGVPSSRWPHHPYRASEPPATPAISTTEELRGLWKVANGWKATPSEGRTYVLGMTTERDSPIYTLFSADRQPFYSLRVDPTSASANITLARRDPSKPLRSLHSDTTPRFSASPTKPSSTSSPSDLTPARGSDRKNWREVFCTTLSDPSRLLPPNDGLLALLYPLSAQQIARSRPNDAAAVTLAKRECARLVWDADSSSHWLVHPALAVPFCVTVERNTAWSRIEYTVEHLEIPQHLARLTRDGTGRAWLEIDTGVAGRIDGAIYMVDVAVAALMVVARGDERELGEVFEPPPVVLPDAAGQKKSASIRSGRSTRGSGRRLSMENLSMHGRHGATHDHNCGDTGGGHPLAFGFSAPPGKKKKWKKTKRKTEQFEVDVESRESEKLGKKNREKNMDDGLPRPVRMLVKLLKVVFKGGVWVAGMGFRALATIVVGLVRSCGVKVK